MRDVFVERGFAAGLFLLLWLYYRWLERVDSKQRLARREKKRRQEQKGSVLIPSYLQWRGTPLETALRPDHYLKSRFAMGVTDPTVKAEERGKEAREAGFL